MKTRIYALLCLSMFHLTLSGVTLDQWPRHLRMDSGVMTIYQPQIDGIDGNVLTGRSAVAFKAHQAKEPVFGAVWLKGTVEINREQNSVCYLDLEVTQTRFPEGLEDAGTEFQAAIKEGMKTWQLDTTLDALKTSLAAAVESEKAIEAFEHEPPEIIVRDRPALLVLIDGKTRLREIEGTPYQHVENTPYPLFHDKKNKSYYLNAADRVWYRAKSEDGPWQIIREVPADLQELVAAQKPGEINTGTAPDLTEANAPEIVVSHKPAELVVTEGEALFTPLVGSLLVIENSETPVFMDVENQSYFLNISGRWYQSASMIGKWSFVQSTELPESFSLIPTESSFADIRAYVAGTDEAREAVMDAQIPQTAAVRRGPVDLQVTYDGNPKFEKVDGTELTFAVNASETILYDGNSYFLVKDGVWYIASRASGPWQVSDKAPPGIAGVQPSSPVYNTKYVYIYASTPEVVYVGYTPGYLSSYVYGPTVVYGTGWVYRPWVGPRYYYPRHATWGFSVRYNPVTGWGFGMSWSNGIFRFSWYSGGGYHRHPWYGAGLYGPGRYRPSHHTLVKNNINIDNSIHINRDNIQNNLYDRKDQLADIKENLGNRPRPEQPTRPERPGLPENRPVALPETLPETRPGIFPDRGNLGENNIFADKEGNIFKKEDGKWQIQDQGGWKDADLTRPSTRPEVSRPNVTLPETRPSTRPNVTLPETRPSTRPNVTLPQTRPSTRPALPQTRPSTRPANSGYNASHSMQRQAHARTRASSASAGRVRAR